MSASERTAVVFDPHPLWLTGVDRLMERIGIQVRASTSEPERALEALEEHRPDLFLTELVGDPADAAAWVRGARERFSEMRVVVLSTHHDPRYIDGALAGGAAAFVIKTAHPDDLASAIRQAFDLSIFYARARAAAAEPVDASSDGHGLTRREVEILRLVAEGKSNADVARQLWVTEQTVKFHLSNVYRKLDVSNRTEASRWAQIRGLVSEPGRA